ncbi:hypothetical protein P879_07601 [Paragonimus westermani]|uniref:LisH domain-containing protein n=1 Tax=Paragonimus westermani TaxID=34504 RepID=A0A8T0DIR1_9TREM|nr:hypothetical protein P879_07601 [Paragonimus westermani]
MSVAKKDTVQLNIFEADIVKLILEFLEKRDLAISLLSLERETGQVNGPFNEDILFFRQLVLEGHVSQIFQLANDDCAHQYADTVMFYNSTGNNQVPVTQDLTKRQIALGAFSEP